MMNLTTTWTTLPTNKSTHRWGEINIKNKVKPLFFLQWEYPPPSYDYSQSSSPAAEKFLTSDPSTSFGFGGFSQVRSAGNKQLCNFVVFHVFAQLNCQKKIDHYEENCMRYCPIKIDLQTESKETESEAQQENTEGAEAQEHFRRLRPREHCSPINNSNLTLCDAPQMV